MKLTKNDLVGIPHSTLSKNKAGNYVIRKEYFYKMGMSAEIIAEKRPTALCRWGNRITNFQLSTNDHRRTKAQ